MITKEEFVKYISSYQEFDKAVERLETAISGKNKCYFIFETDWCEAVGRMLDIFLDSHFTKDGSELITWWLWEDVDKIIYEKVDPDLFNGETELEYNIENFDNLWNYMIKHKKNYFRNE